MFCLNTCFCFVESQDFLYEYQIVYDKVFLQNIEKFNKTKTDVEAERTNIPDIYFFILFAQPKKSENVVTMCIAFQCCERVY